MVFIQCICFFTLLAQLAASQPEGELACMLHSLV